MANTQDNPASLLLPEIKSDLDKWAREEEIDFRARYEPAIRSIGEIEFLTELFRRFEGSTLSGALNALPFAWKSLPYSAWLEILYRISEDRDAIYQFIWFASPFLGIDILGLIRADPAVNEKAKEFVRLHFPGGAPKGGDSERELMQSIGVDPVAMWRRLASEGAPMKIDLSVL